MYKVALHCLYKVFVLFKTHFYLKFIMDQKTLFFNLEEIFKTFGNL